MTDLLQDIRYALRTFKRTAGLTVVIVASLAIGIGANTAVFSVVNALLLKPLPYPDPDRLAVLWLRSPGINIPQDWPSPGQFIDVKNENRSFAELSISQGRTGTLIGRAGETPFAEPQRVEALLTSSSLFHLLGAKALYGRLLLPDEDVPGKAPVVVLSNAFWKRAFNADPNIVGKTDRAQRVLESAGFDAAIRGCRRPRRRLLVERRDHADGGEHAADGSVPAAPSGRRCRESPRRRELQSHGAAETGRDDGAGARRRRRHRRADSRQGQARPNLHDRRRAARRIRRRQCATRRVGGDGLRDPRTAHRVRERREPVAHASERAPKGNRRPCRTRSALAAARAPTPHRNSPARSHGWRCRTARRRARPRRDSRHQSGQHSATRRDRSRRTGPRIHVRRVDPDRHPLRSGARVAGSACRHQLDAQVGRQEYAGRRRAGRLAAAPAKSSGRGRNGDLDGVARRRGAAHSQLRAVAERLPGV